MKVRLIVVAISLALVAGCTAFLDEGEEIDRPKADPAAVSANWPGCLKVRAYRDLNESYAKPDGSIPADFRPVRAVTCDTDTRTEADGAIVSVAIEKTATDLGLLTPALGLPSRQIVRSGNTACPAMAWIRPWLFLVDAEGRWIYPAIPVTGCGFPRPEVDAALQQLTETPKVLKRLQILESAEAVKAGCTQRWKEMVSLTLEEPASSAVPGAVTADPFRGRPIRRCLYQSGDQGGEFVRGREVSEADRKAVIDALVDAEPPTAACTQRTDLFALVRRTDEAGPLVYVELDHCRRILISDTNPDSYAAAGSELVRLLAAS